MTMVQVFSPLVLRPEIEAHSSAVQPHDCRLDAMIWWVELMASSEDRDVRNAVMTEVFEELTPEMARRFPWGPAARGLHETWTSA